MSSASALFLRISIFCQAYLFCCGEELGFLPAGVKVVAGGSGTGIYKNVIHKIGGVVLNDFKEFREFLRTG